MIDRWGKNFRKQSSLSFRDIEKMGISMDIFFKRLKQDQREKKLLIIPIDVWTENYLLDWFKKNYNILGLEGFLEEHTKEYNRLKKDMEFEGYPDFLANFRNKIIRVEVECFPCNFNHSTDYCEIVLCYELNNLLEKNKKWFGLKEILGYNEVIIQSEVLDYMRLRYDDFRQEIHDKINVKWENETE